MEKRDQLFGEEERKRVNVEAAFNSLRTDEERITEESYEETTLTSIQEETKEQSLILSCIDPQSAMFFRLDLLKNQFRIDPQPNGIPNLNKKVAHHLHIMNTMLNPNPHFIWLYQKSQEVNRYRRRRFPQ